MRGGSATSTAQYEHQFRLDLSAVVHKHEEHLGDNDGQPDMSRMLRAGLRAREPPGSFAQFDGRLMVGDVSLPPESVELASATAAKRHGRST